MKKAVMIIAENNFRDEELLQPKEILEHSGVKVSIASTSLGACRGVLGAVVKPDILVKDVKVDDFDIVIFVGGAGASQYWDDPAAHGIARDAQKSGKVLAAICIAPVTLARAGLLQGRRATVWPSESQELSSRGAEYTAKAVERDANIITANGPQSAPAFAEEILKGVKIR